ncbi:hypothetical protein O0L34_g15889 [Tuta absoluta]|nr:hypothetical protein O0L34_g15889 [Tuta absoluta]
MSTKPLENCIRELQNTVKVLVNKVTILDCKISEQTKIITKQNSIIEQLLTPNNCTLTLPTPKTQSTTNQSRATQPSQPLQRQPRTAHTKAVEALSKSKKKNVSPKLSDVVAGRSNSPLDANRAQPTTPETPTEPPERALERAAESAQAPKADCERASSGATKPTEASQALNSPLTYSDTEEGNIGKQFQQPHKKSRRVIRATGEVDLELRTMERTKFIHAWNFHPDMTDTHIKAYLDKKKPDLQFLIQKPDPCHDSHNCFLIGASAEHFEFIRSPSNWPTGTALQPWFSNRQPHDKKQHKKTFFRVNSPQ